jgi:ubiquinone/menaquinone biosynthesis C-methylase UbiE
MADRNKSRPLMKWKKMDAMDMDYEDESFDVVIDKSEE